MRLKRPVRTTLGSEVHQMTYREILDSFNAGIRATEALTAEYQYVAVEIPLGRLQIAYFSQGDQWTPRGDVLRCVIDEGPDRMPLIHVDDHELSWAQFGKLLLTYGGWGMRIVFVPDDRLDEEPEVEMSEPAIRNDRWQRRGLAGAERLAAARGRRFETHPPEHADPARGDTRDIAFLAKRATSPGDGYGGIAGLPGPGFAGFPMSTRRLHAPTSTSGVSRKCPF